MMKLHPCIALATIALTASYGQIQAQSVSATFRSVSPGLTLTGTFDGSTSKKLNTGVMSFDEFDAFCVEPYQTITKNQNLTFNVQSTFMSPGVSEAIAHLVGGYYASGQTAQEAASTQWAIWEVVVDGINSPSMTSGNNQVFDSATATLAQQYLDNIASLPKADVVYLTNKKYQDMVTVVPEPSSAALLGLGIIGFLIRRKRG